MPKVSAGGARAAIAVAEIGPMPGTVISQRDATSSRARRAISWSRSVTLPLKLGQQVQHQSEHGVGHLGKRAGHLFFLDQIGKHRHVPRPLRCDPSIFVTDGAERRRASRRPTLMPCHICHRSLSFTEGNDTEQCGKCSTLPRYPAIDAATKNVGGVRRRSSPCVSCGGALLFVVEITKTMPQYAKNPRL